MARLGYRGLGPRLAGAVAAAHVIECGPQATGGNFSGFTTVPRVDDLGYPIAEIAADGTAVITKHEVAGGTVTTDTVTAQLLYEIQGPTYLNPDVTVHLDDVVLTQLAPDRVEITGVTGSPPPPTTKLAMTAPGGCFGRAFALHGADVLNLWRPGETEHETTYASANVGDALGVARPAPRPRRALRPARRRRRALPQPAPAVPRRDRADAPEAGARSGPGWCR